MSLIPFVFLGLLLFSLCRREYLRFFFAAAGTACLFALPWYAHVWVNRGAFGHPIDAGVNGEFSFAARYVYKVFWLLVLNVVMVLLMFRAWGMTRWNERRNQLLLAVVLGFSPMLLTYGGRYFTHTIHLWAILLAVVFAGKLSRRPSARRIAASIALAVFCPTLLFLGVEREMHPGPMIGLSGWFAAPLAACGGMTIVDDLLEEHGALSVRAARRFGEHLQDITPPGQVLDIKDNLNAATLIGFYANRPIVQAAWPEVAPVEGARPEGSVAPILPPVLITRDADLPASRPELDWTPWEDLFIGRSKDVPVSQEP